MFYTVEALKEVIGKAKLTDEELMAILRCTYTVSIPKGSFEAVTITAQDQIDKILKAFDNPSDNILCKDKE